MDTQVQDNWFEAVMKADRWFSRKDDKNLLLSFDGYKCENYSLAEEVIMAAGGSFMSVEFDKVCGKTFVVVREPKAVLRERDPLMSVNQNVEI